MDEPTAPILQDKSAAFSHQHQPVTTSPHAASYPEPPPSYTQHDPRPIAVPQAYPSQVPAPYPNQAPVTIMPIPVAQPPVQQIIAPAPQPAAQVVVVGGAGGLPPGTCTVCRNGRMKNSASLWTWLCCCLLLPVGILPGLFVFCCCCREPKCTNCGYTP